ncbi:MAG: T9SS type A sorting domain-containing protein, partial [Prevotellaceae bacterium]|nr:T9SS type A sorting domain-containing protein [Prevotellaceae bacterium]
STGSGVAKNSLTDSEAAQYTLENVLGSDGWNPRSKTEITAAATLTADTVSISWAAVDYALCYVVYRNGQQHTFTTATTYTPAGAEADTIAIYTVQVAAESGALSDMSNAVHLAAAPAAMPPIPTAVATAPTTPLLLYPNPTNGLLTVNASARSQLEVFNAQGVLVHSCLVEGKASINLSQLPAGIYLVKMEGKMAKVVKQ